MNEEFGLKQLPSTKELEIIQNSYPELDKESVLIILKFVSINKEITKAYNHFFGQYHLTDAKFYVLMILYRAEKNTLFPYQIAEQLGITRASVTTLLDGLDKKNLITRQHDTTDRRKIMVTLSNQGKKCLKDILPIHYNLTQEMVSTFSTEQKNSFLNSLSKLEEGIEKYKKQIFKE